MQNTEKLRWFRIPAMLLAALAVGAVLGICFERTVGVSLSDRLARRIGTANAQVVSCARSGPFSSFEARYADVFAQEISEMDRNS